MRSKFKWIFTLLVAFTMQFSFAQEKTVTGLVSDELGPIAGANVVVEGTTRGTTTDFDGKYTIKAKQGEVLVISYTGKKVAKISVTAASTYNVSLKDDVVEGKDVVIQGYKTVTKKSSVIASAVVDTKTIENRPNANVMNTLQGQLSGVNITASSGQPGAKSEVIIRGYGTINGNTDPLYVIDGFPSNADAFRSINPNDVETVTVLKDASATSQYGNRGTNGVILIKTKRSALGSAKSSFRYSSQYGVGYLQNPKYKYANAKQLLKIEQNFGAGLGATLTDADIDAYDVDTDWVDYFFRPSNTQTHNLSFDNASEKMSSFTSLGYTKQDGILFTTGLQRFNLRNNIGGKSANDKFTYQVSTSFGYSKNNEATNLGTGAINRNYINGAFLGAPYVSPDVYTGSASAFDFYNNTPGLLATPILLIDKLNTYENLTEETRIEVATDFAYKLTDNFTLRTRLNGLYLSNRFFQAEFPNSFNALLFSPTAGVSSLDGGAFNGFEDINQRREFVYNNLYQLDYSKKFNKHTIGASLNFEYNYSKLNSNNFRQRGLDPILFVPNTGAGYISDNGTDDNYVPQISASSLRNDLVSYFGMFDYDYDSKYGISASFRRDGTSRFLEDYRWGNFWSVGGRWNIDEEAFMENVTNVNVLKLRASYGSTGNQRIANGSIYAGIIPPPYVNSWTLANNNYAGGQGYNLNLGRPENQWETTYQANVGVDLEMYNSRLRTNIDVYNRITKDLFIDNPISAVVGSSGLRGNSDANVTNKGVELNVAYDIFKSDDFLFTLRANGSYNKNTVDGLVSNGGKVINQDGSGYSFITQNGGSIYEAYVYPYIGVNPVNGNLLFEDINGNATENPFASDRRATGKNFVPTYQGGFGFDLSYKGFFASTTFTYVLDTWRFDSDEESLFDVGNIGQFVVGSDMLDAWTPTNTDTDVPSLSATNTGATGNSDRFLRDASYLRLRNAQIGYKVPSKLLERTFISDLSFTVQGENLFTLTKWKGFDAESNRLADGSQYPTAKIFTFGVDIKF